MGVSLEWINEDIISHEGLKELSGNTLSAVDMSFNWPLWMSWNEVSLSLMLIAGRKREICAEYRSLASKVRERFHLHQLCQFGCLSYINTTMLDVAFIRIHCVNFNKKCTMDINWFWTSDIIVQKSQATHLYCQEKGK